MKILVEKNTNLVKFIFRENDFLDLQETQIVCKDFIIGCHNKHDTIVYNKVNPPIDFKFDGNKYMYDGTNWTLNPNWVDPLENNSPQN